MVMSIIGWRFGIGGEGCHILYREDSQERMSSFVYTGKGGRQSVVGLRLERYPKATKYTLGGEVGEWSGRWVDLGGLRVKVKWKHTGRHT